MEMNAAKKDVTEKLLPAMLANNMSGFPWISFSLDIPQMASISRPERMRLSCNMNQMQTVN